MRALALAVLLAAPADAAVIELVPSVRTTPAVVPVVPVLTPSPLLTPALPPLAPSLLPAALVPTALPAPVALVPLKAAPSAPEKPDADAQARALVARLLAKDAEPAEELASAFDGLQDVELPGAVDIGTSLETRNGGYTLSHAETETDGDLITRHEKWRGADGKTLWVRRRLSPDRWEISEWNVQHAPKGFAPGGLPLPPAFYAELELNANNRMTSNIDTKSKDGRVSTMVDAKKAFKAALAHFGDKVEGIKGTWVYGDNLAEFNRLTAKGLTPEEAAALTWTGRLAAEAGYTKVELSDLVRGNLAKKAPGAHESMGALFVRP